MDPERFRQVEVRSRHELRDWLTEHHTADESVWLVTYKRSAGDLYVSRDEVLDELVAFGWTDGVRRGLDDERTMQLISPRRTKAWAASYKSRALRLIDQGRMHPAGLASIEEAMKGGGWTAMDDVDALIIPADLEEALNARPPAAAEFAAFPRSVRRNILRWIASAKSEATRARRIALTANEAEAGRRVRSHG